MFRHEPSDDPARLQIFHQHEMVRIGEPEAVLAWREEWAQRGLELLRSLGLAAERDAPPIRSSAAAGACLPRTSAQRS